MQPSEKALNRAPGTPVITKITLTKSDLSKLDSGFLSAKQKLEYVARTEGFQVIYNDFLNKVSFFKVLWGCRIFFRIAESFSSPVGCVFNVYCAHEIQVSEIWDSRPNLEIHGSVRN